ncbi:hypothetical protein FF1_035732 [Malus domestica]
MASIPPLQSSKFQKSRDPNPVLGPAFKCTNRKSTVSIPGLGFGDQIDGAAIVLRGARCDGPCKALSSAPTAAAKSPSPAAPATSPASEPAVPAPRFPPER